MCWPKLVFPQNRVFKRQQTKSHRTKNNLDQISNLRIILVYKIQFYITTQENQTQVIFRLNATYLPN